MTQLLSNVDNDARFHNASCAPAALDPRTEAVWNTGIPNFVGESLDACFRMSRPFPVVRTTPSSDHPTSRICTLYAYQSLRCYAVSAPVSSLLQAIQRNLLNTSRALHLPYFSLTVVHIRTNVTGQIVIPGPHQLRRVIGSLQFCKPCGLAGCLGRKRPTSIPCSTTSPRLPLVRWSSAYVLNTHGYWTRARRTSSPGSHARAQPTLCRRYVFNGWPSSKAVC